ncbi:MAG: hypothetical protein M1839_004824 [Geoglossum umbratile]|nr:MAG: hypothetical protein M1839_004824 [Geoglossum umbratile]
MVSKAGTFFIVLFVILVLFALSYIIFTQLRARRLGLPPPAFSTYNPFHSSRSASATYPAPAPGGIQGWIADKYRAMRRKGGAGRTAGGAYEGPSGYEGARGGGARRGFGPLDPDEAWDARVGHEADPYGPGPGGYYEEQELGLHSERSTAYPAAPAHSPPTYQTSPPTPPRGRSQSRDPTPQNPFDDSAATQSNISTRGLSPRPGSRATQHHDDEEGERRSVFREDIS